jgi:mRNA-degrading endonuclease RelE of RelBE toxin-antitoxin system
MYAVRFTSAAVTDLTRLRVFMRRRVLGQIRRQLVADPVTLTRRKKIISGEAGTVRQLRVGDYRVYYDVLHDEAAVLVWGVRHKGRRTTGEIL